MSEIIKLTLEEIQNNPPVINKKFLLINSSFYTDEAFEYLLTLVDNTDSVVFIPDKQEIYTHGTFYGGDIWKESLFYFKTFQIFDDTSNQLISEISADTIDDILKISASNNINLSVEEEVKDGKTLKTLKIGVKLDNIVDETPFTIDDPTAIFKLKYENNQILVDKYIPIRVEVEDNTNILEYDNTDIETINFNINIFGSSITKSINITSTSNENISRNDNIITSTVRSNDDIDYLILYSDGITEGNIHYIQKFGYALCWGNYEINSRNFFGQDKIISKDSCNCEFNLNCSENEYCWFACPSIYKPVFKDEYSGLIGGWKKYSTFNIYSKNIEYTVYRTENSGLGNVKWFVTNK